MQGGMVEDRKMLSKTYDNILWITNHSTVTNEDAPAGLKEVLKMLAKEQQRAG